jgi:GNAT superfamily N-acetyltransferase
VETGDLLSGGAADAAVRVAVPADADAVGAVQSRAWRAAYRGVLPSDALAELTPERLAGTWHESIARPPTDRHAVMVATAGGTVVGFVAVGPDDDPDAGPDVGRIVTLVVDPAHQRAGHGSRLLSAAASALRDRQAPAVRVWIPADDAPLRTFLLSAGLVLDGASRTLRGPDGGHVTEVRLAAALQDGT